MTDSNQIDLVKVARDHIATHDVREWHKLAAFLAELNDSNSGFSRLRDVDLDSEEILSRKLFSALLNEQGELCHCPALLAASISGHAVRIELRGNFYSIIATILGVATAVLSVQGGDSLALIVVFAIATLIMLWTKWTSDKYLSLLRRILIHLQSFGSGAGG